MMMIMMMLMMMKWKDDSDGALDPWSCLSYRLQILHGSSYGLSNQMTKYKSTKSTKVQKYKSTKYKTKKYKNTKTHKMQICKKMQKRLNKNRYPDIAWK